MKKYFLNQLQSNEDILRALRNSALLAAFFALLYVFRGMESVTNGDATGYLSVVVGIIILPSQAGLAWAAHKKLQSK